MAKSSVRVTVGERELSITNRDKVFFPGDGFTKGQLIDYYLSIAPAMLPHIEDRPLTMRRYPDGVAGKSFFEKHVPSAAPKWVRTTSVPTASGEDTVEYAVVCDLPTLIWAANLGTIEFHVPQWRVGRRRKLPGPPDLLVFDLDPGEGTTIVECCKVAVLITAILDKRGIEAFYKTSGSKGLQLYAAIDAKKSWDAVGNDAHEIALSLEKDHPELVVANMRKALRNGKVLIDWSQNSPAKTTVAAYSVRGRAEPTVSTPVTLKEVRACASKGNPSDLRFVTADVIRRVEKSGDLFEGLGNGAHG